jgi:putative ABC transport system permease protein
MLKNFIKISFRSLKRNRLFSLINIFGLAFGLSVCLLIIFYIKDELSYDKYNSKFNRIYRVNSEMKYNGTTTLFAICPPPLGQALVRNFPEVESSVRFSLATNMRFKNETDEFEENKVAYCDSSLFNIFSFHLLEGDAKSALVEPKTIILSESTARKYFNSTNVVGKTITLDNDHSIYKVTGIIADIPEQSHFHFDLILSMASLDESKEDNWQALNYNTYILLRSNTDTVGFEKKISDFFRKSLANSNFDVNAFEKSGNYFGISLMPLKDIHLKSNRFRELDANSDIQYVYIYAAIAILILVLACVNFMNLSTARSTNRAREVGVRKVLGSSKKYLVLQFLCESLILTSAAIILAIIIARLLLPTFNELSGKNLTITIDTLKWLFPSIIILILIVGCSAGLYPAFFLSSFNPATVLKGKVSTGFKGFRLRSALVVLQFSISIFFIISTLIVFNQLNYIQSKNLGYGRNNILIVKNTSDIANPEIFKQEVKKIPGVLDATLTSFLPTSNNRWPRAIFANRNTSIQSEFWTVDADYINTLGIQMVKGRNFDSQMLTDSSGIIINQTAANQLGISDDPTNRILYCDTVKYHVIGVVRDFNFNSLRENISPVAMVLSHDWRSSLSIKVKNDKILDVLKSVQDKWNGFSRLKEMNYSFMDDDFNRIYSSEVRIGKTFTSFTALSILIACLGLFGLAVFASEQRTKEIGIRKILGADVSTILGLLTRDFILLVIISSIISSPLAWWVMKKWLEGFAYRDNIKWWVFLIGNLSAIVIAAISVSIQSIRAALVNPVISLKTE